MMEGHGDRGGRGTREEDVMATGLARIWGALREGFGDSAELQERLALLNRPWAEDHLHWVDGEDGPELHGTLVPPKGWRHFSTTHRGWCQAMTQH
jgi:hypothetical protein